MAREHGTVIFFNAQKGYGFLRRHHASDVFVHFTGIDMQGYKMLHEGDEVEFEVTKSEKGPMAVGVKVLATPQAT